MFLLLIAGSLLNQLETSSVALFFRQSMWLYSIVEIVHIVSFSLLVGAAILFDFRLLGLSKKLPVIDCLNILSVWAKASFAFIIPSGFILFMVDATAMAGNTAFLTKLVLILLAVLNAWIFRQYIIRDIRVWNKGVSSPWKAKVAAVFSVLLWIAVISCGRLIAYI